MTLTFGEKVKVILNRKGITIKDLAEALGTTRQNLTNKFSRDNFSEKEMIQIAEKIGCTYDSTLLINDTNEEI